MALADIVEISDSVDKSVSSSNSLVKYTSSLAAATKLQGAEDRAKTLGSSCSSPSIGHQRGALRLDEERNCFEWTTDDDIWCPQNDEVFARALSNASNDVGTDAAKRFNSSVAGKAENGTVVNGVDDDVSPSIRTISSGMATACNGAHTGGQAKQNAVFSKTEHSSSFTEELGFSPYSKRDGQVVCRSNGRNRAEGISVSNSGACAFDAPTTPKDVCGGGVLQSTGGASGGSVTSGGGGGRTWNSLVDSLTGKKTPTMKKKPAPLTRHDIGEPTVVDSARLRAKLERLGCVDLNPSGVAAGLDPFTSSSSPSPCSPMNAASPALCTPTGMTAQPPLLHSGLTPPPIYKDAASLCPSPATSSVTDVSYPIPSAVSTSVRCGPCTTLGSTECERHKLVASGLDSSRSNFVRGGAVAATSTESSSAAELGNTTVATTSASIGYNNVFRSSKKYAERRVYVTSSSSSNQHAAAKASTGDQSRVSLKSKHRVGRLSHDPSQGESASSGSAGSRSQFEEEPSWGNSEEDAELRDCVSEEFVRPVVTQAASATVPKARIGSVYDNVAVANSSTRNETSHIQTSRDNSSVVADRQKTLVLGLTNPNWPSRLSPARKIAVDVSHNRDAQTVSRSYAVTDAMASVRSTPVSPAINPTSELDLILDDLYRNIETLDVRGASVDSQGSNCSTARIPRSSSFQRAADEKTTGDNVTNLNQHLNSLIQADVGVVGGDFGLHPSDRFDERKPLHIRSDDQSASRSPSSYSPCSPSPCSPSPCTPSPCSPSWHIGLQYQSLQHAGLQHTGLRHTGLQHTGVQAAAPSDSTGPILVEVCTSVPGGNTVLEEGVSMGTNELYGWSYTNDNDRDTDCEGGVEGEDRGGKTAFGGHGKREKEEEEEPPERRDSGVGSSLTRQYG